MGEESKPRKVQRVGAGHDEPNLNRLMFVVAANRVPEDAVGWKKNVIIDDFGPVQVQCTAGRGNVVPHGIDNDVVVGLVNAYVLQGMPEDGTILLTVAELIRLSGLSKNGRIYHELRQSVLRLADTKYDFTKSWYDAEQQDWLDEEGFRLILHYRILTPKTVGQPGTQFKAESALSITLAPLLARSIRSGHLRPLDLEFYSQLSQPMIRTLYRLLREQSFRPNQPPVQSFSIGMRAWAVHLGMQDTRIDLVRRALKPAHEELRAKGFLRDVAYLGRGEQQTVIYHFAENLQPPPDPAMVTCLASRGVSPPAATKLASEYTRPQIEQACETFDALLRANYRPTRRGGLMTDILRTPGKYVVETSATPAPVRKAVTPSPAPEEPSPPVLDARTAEFLMGRIKQPLSDARRSILVDLYLSGAVTAQELASLNTCEDVDGVVMTWIARRGRQEGAGAAL